MLDCIINKIDRQFHSFRYLTHSMLTTTNFILSKDEEQAEIFKNIKKIFR